MVLAKVVVMTVAAEDVKAVVLKHVVLDVAMIVPMDVSKGAVVDAERTVIFHVNLDVKKTVCLGAGLVVLGRAPQVAAAVARQHVYKVVTMAVETHVVEVVPTVVHLVAVVCYTAVVVLEFNQDHHTKNH